MRYSFRCHICGRRGSQQNTSTTPFVFAYWYTERSGLEHGCLYCRLCGGVHDTVGTVLGGLRLLFGGFPSKVVVSYTTDAFQQAFDAGDILWGLPGIVARAMVEDGRLPSEWLSEEHMSPDSR